MQAHSSIRRYFSNDTIDAYYLSYDTLFAEKKWGEIIEKGESVLAVANEWGKRKDEAVISAHLALAALRNQMPDQALNHTSRCRRLSKEFCAWPAFYINVLQTEMLAYSTFIFSKDYQARSKKTALEIIHFFHEKAPPLFEAKNWNDLIPLGVPALNASKVHLTHWTLTICTLLTCFARLDNNDVLAKQFATSCPPVGNRLGEILAMDANSLEEEIRALLKVELIE